MKHKISVILQRLRDAKAEANWKYSLSKRGWYPATQAYLKYYPLIVEMSLL